MRRAICLLMLLLPGSSLAAEEKTATVVQRLEGRKLTFGTGLGTKFEGLAVALLGSCHAETTFHVGNQERWDEALKGNHVLVTFVKPRLFGVTSGEKETVSAQEILVPIGPAQRPDHIFVRDGDRIRAFSKFEYDICEPFMKQLEKLLPLPSPKQQTP